MLENVSSDSKKTGLNTKEALQTAIRNLEKEMGSDKLWNYYAHSGPYYVCQYFLMCDWMKVKTSPSHRENLKSYLLSSRLSDGSWQQVLEKNHSRGDWNTTLLAYWFLKTTDVDKNFLEPSLAYLKKQSLHKSANVFSKFMLALFGQISWRKIAPLPSLLFFESLPFGYRRLAQWVIPNLLPLAVLREVKATRLPSKEHSLFELTNWQTPNDQELKLNILQKVKVNWLIQKIMKDQSPSGGWGGYAHATLFCLSALNYVDQKKFKFTENKSMNFINDLYFASSNSIGRTCDGSYWDTLLVLEALQASNYSQLSLDQLIINLIHKTDPITGALGFGFGFENDPDIDDTARLLKLAYLENVDFSNFQKKALLWILDQQNTDGGWGAFSKNNYPSGFLKKVFGSYLDTASLFDESCADSTGTVLLTLAHFKHDPKVKRSIDHAIQYLKKTQHKDGYWIGRWAINSIFGTSMVVRGITACGISSEERFVAKSLNWLSQKQNLDGGFGESSDSYTDSKWIAHGQSTPTQTAWASHALLNNSKKYSKIINKAENYLLENFDLKNGWQDNTVVGTGHPGTFYFVYPSYAKIFPILFLSSRQKS